MSDPKLFALGRCFTCDTGFDFDPETVTTVMIDPLTNRPPDVGPDAQPIDPDPAAVERSVPKMICPPCVIKVRAAGNQLI